jgi:hypothetical protein
MTKVARMFALLFTSAWQEAAKDADMQDFYRGA